MEIQMDDVNIVAEHQIKIEEIKLEWTDHSEEEVSNWTEGGHPYSLKREVKEEGEEEELKPPVRVFLNPEEVPNEQMKQEHEDPLAMCNEDYLGKSEESRSGEYAPEDALTDFTIRIGSDVEKTSYLFNKETKLTLVNSTVKPNENVAGNNNTTENVSNIKSNNDAHIDDHPGCVRSLSERESEVMLTPEGDRCHECSLCQKSFRGRAQLVRHMRIHSGERPHQCPVCEKCFSQKTVLVAHMRIHSGERPYQCSVCLKSFSRKDGIVGHMRVHSGERPYQCSVCHKSFSRKYGLVKHVRIHSGERPYKCSVCYKNFTERSNFVSHMRIHTGERPHECSVCRKNFTERGNLVTHMRIHTGERRYECSVCHKSFSQKGNLTTHMRVHSGKRH